METDRAKRDRLMKLMLDHVEWALWGKKGQVAIYHASMAARLSHRIRELDEA